MQRWLPTLGRVVMTPVDAGIEAEREFYPYSVLRADSRANRHDITDIEIDPQKLHPSHLMSNLRILALLLLANTTS